MISESWCIFLALYIVVINYCSWRLGRLLILKGRGVRLLQVNQAVFLLRSRALILLMRVGDWFLDFRFRGSFWCLLWIIRLEQLFDQELVERFVWVYEYSYICLAWDHIQTLHDIVTPVFQVLAKLFYISVQLFQIVLHKVYLSVITFLYSVQYWFIRSLKHINGQIQLVQAPWVFILGNISFYLLLLQLLILNAYIRLVFLLNEWIFVRLILIVPKQRSCNILILLLQLP